MIIAWEQRVLCNMPHDLKSFYLTTDGLHMSWNSRIAEMKYNVGKIKINSLNQLLRIGGVNCSSSNTPSLNDIDIDDDDDEDIMVKAKQPRFDNRSRIFELDSCNSFGKICLVYLDTKPGSDNYKYFCKNNQPINTNFSKGYKLTIQKYGFWIEVYNGIFYLIHFLITFI